MPRETGPSADDALPLKPQWFHILLALSRGPAHGSGIVRAILDETDERIRLWPATLYGSLDDLAGRGWIEELPDGERPDGASERKRIYRLTGPGREVLAAEARRMRSLAHAALERIAAGSGIR